MRRGIVNAGNDVNDAVNAEMKSIGIDYKVQGVQRGSGIGPNL